MTEKDLYPHLLARYGSTMGISVDELRLACTKTIGHATGYYYQVGKRVPTLSRDDLIQAGVVGLMNAITFYDEGKGGFWPYAQYIIRKEIFKAIRQNSPVFPRHRWHGDYPTYLAVATKW